MNENVVTYNEHNPKGVVLTFSEENFASMILNFLGHKQKLQYIIRDTHFVIDKEILAQFHYLLVKKIEKEQFTHLNSFMVQLQYNDNTTRLIHGVEQLLSFLETQPLIPESITLSWKIILQFPNAATIESQDIEVTFNIDADDYYGDSIYLNVAHTNQSWGTEVLNLFKDHINTFIQKKPRQVKIAEVLKLFLVPRTLNELILVVGMILLPLLAYLDLSNTHDNTAIEQIVKMTHYENNVTVSKEFIISMYLIEKKIDKDINISSIQSPEYRKVVKDYIQKIDQQKHTKIKKIASVFFLLGGIITFAIFFLRQNKKYYQLKSFILLTDKAQITFKNFQDSKSKFEYFSITALLIGLLIGVIGNFIYQWLI